MDRHVHRRGPGRVHCSRPRPPEPPPRPRPRRPCRHSLPRRATAGRSGAATTPAPPRYPRGDSGNEVREVQCLLRRCGYDVPVDGLFGAGLEAVVKRFQRDHGLAPDGTVGPGTWQALRKCGTTAAA
ncbi:peptidoglycan-binding protein [Streptomyces tricolor]|nr:peptidoglycan-binding protein [Streptomyces tricolor]